MTYMHASGIQVYNRVNTLAEVPTLFYNLCMELLLSIILLCIIIIIIITCHIQRLFSVHVLFPGSRQSVASSKVNPVIQA